MFVVELCACSYGDVNEYSGVLCCWQSVFICVALWTAGSRRGLGRVEPSSTAHPGVIAGWQLCRLGSEEERADYQDT